MDKHIKSLTSSASQIWLNDNTEIFSKKKKNIVIRSFLQKNK